MFIGVATHAVGVGHALGIVNVADLMRLVAVHAGRQNVRFFLPELAADRFAMHFFDLGVAFSAGGSDVASVDRRIWVSVRQDVVGRVAGNAIGRNDQTLLEKRLAVNALGIILQDVVLVNLAVGLNRRALLVASSANEWDFQWSHGRVPIRNGHDVVIAVAIHAMRSQGVAAGYGSAVQRMRVLLLLVTVAGAAFDARQGRGVGQILTFQIGVARGARQRAVH